MTKTQILDIDGTLIYHHGEGLYNQATLQARLLPGVKEKIEQWILDDSMIILITGRKESMRQLTEKQLEKLCIPYDILIMGLPRGPRILINDMKPDTNTEMAVAHNVIRNEGLVNLP